MTKIIFFLGNWIPTFILLGLISLTFKSIHNHHFILFSILYIYFFPLVLYRTIFLIFPKKEGKFEVMGREHLLWWYGIQLQTIYSRFSFFEELLRIVPMLYSFWLRLWGSKVGSAVFWSPKVLIADRGDLNINNFCVVGFGVKFTSHLIVKSHNKDFFVFGKINIGEKVIVGAETNIGPGVKIENSISIAALSTLLPFSVWKNSKEYTPREN